MTGFDADQRRRVLELAAAARADPGARDWTSVGCVGLVFAAAGFGLLPSVARLIGPRGAFVAAIVLGVLTVAGLALWLLGASLGLAPIHRRVASAAELLAASGAVPTDAALAASVTLLVNAHHSPGPFTAGTFDRGEMEKRLAGALPLVIEVEKVLVEEGVIYPVFTPVPPAGG